MRDFEGKGDMTQEMFDSLPPGFRDPISMISTAPTLSWRFQLAIVGGGGVARARNYIVTEFMKAKQAEYLFFVDVDLRDETPQKMAQNYVRVLSHMDRKGWPICGGLYTIRAPEGHWVINFPSAEGPDGDGILRLLELGTGFKCYRKSALQKIIEKNPWLEYFDDDHKELEWGVFSMGPVKSRHWKPNARWLTEDYWLDWLTEDAGLPVVVDTTIQLRHWDEHKKVLFPSKFPPLPVRDEAALERARALLATPAPVEATVAAK
jgi:hypothetical protein